MKLNNEQEFVCQSLIKWSIENINNKHRPKSTSSIPGIIKKPKKQITVVGYAGTGKTTILATYRARLRKQMTIPVAFATFTGKASLVLKNKLEQHTSGYLTGLDSISTIHKLIYRPEYKKDKHGNKILVNWVRIEKGDLDVELIIIDEASMISKKLWDDLTYFDVPIVAVGDHGQLPPVGDQFSILKNPDLVLTKIHRQAENNPIIKMSMYVRNSGYIPHGIHDNNYEKENGPRLFKMSWNNDPQCQSTFFNIDFSKDDVICLCGLNHTRVGINKLIRDRLMNHNRQEPYPGEKVICLKNNYDDNIFNGQTAVVEWFKRHSKDIYSLTLDFGDGELFDCLSNKCCFNQEKYDGAFELVNSKNVSAFIKGTIFNSVNLFDFGYCISVHKSQGSEWDKVVVFEERSQYWNDDFYKRWLYTAITRAREKLFVISN